MSIACTDYTVVASQDVKIIGWHKFRMTTCLENLEMSGSLTVDCCRGIGQKSKGKLFIANFTFGATPVFSRPLHTRMYTITGPLHFALYKCKAHAAMQTRIDQH